MIVKRWNQDRGRTKTGWLDSWHTFSFNQYYDPEQMGFRALRVINDDRVIPGAGFATHGHRDMEIITYVMQGELEHKDSMGNGSIIPAGDAQYMSAGTGVRHSERNPSPSEFVHLLQIWIIPESAGLEPLYDQRTVQPEKNHGKLRLIASRDGREDSIKVRQDVDLYVAVLKDGESVKHSLASNRHAWLHVARGLLKLNGDELRAGDGAAISNEELLEISTDNQAEFLLFDLA
ncbi:MAG: pirin family protein [Pyrinomonadaceae bacterium]